MSTVDTIRAGPEQMQRWRRQVGGQRRRRGLRGPRPYAAISYVFRGPVQDGLIDLRRLAFVVLHDELRRDGSLATRFRCYSASAIPWGIKLGGAENTRFDKDLTVPPRKNARGHAFALADADFLGRALDLDRYLERRFHLPGRYDREPRLPKIWAAFPPQNAGLVHGGGPEFIASGSDLPRRGLSSGEQLFPLEFVSHEWRSFARLFVEFGSIPKRQLVSLNHRGAGLAGFSGAVEFDFRNSRFSTPAAACA